MPDLSPDAIGDDALWRSQVPRILGRALPGRALRACTAMAGGVINGMYRIEVAGSEEPLVLRFYARDPAACRKEVDLHRLVAGRVPVPEILYSGTGDGECGTPHVLMRWVSGLSFRQLKARRDPAEIAQAAYSIGETLARIGSFEFSSPGRIEPGPTVGPRLLAAKNGAAEFVEACLRSPAAQLRLPAPRREKVREFIWSRAARMEPLGEERRLVHSDYGGPNLLLDRVDGRWRVSGVVDWEFAFSGPPLVDVGHMLRYEREARPLVEPWFSDGYREAGGTLPGDWRDLARALDLTALCEMLTRPQLPDAFVPELVELIAATTGDGDAA